MPRDESRYSFEVKWDGVRAIAYCKPGRIRLESRNLNEITDAYPEVRGILLDLGMREAVLDGEIVAFDDAGKPSFERLQSRMHVTSPNAIKRLSKSSPVVYAIFDLLHLDGETLMALPYEQRRERLEALGLGGPAWRVPAVQRGAGTRLLAATEQQGLEGVVAKRLDSRYEPGRRTGAWIKIKHVRRQELVIGGWLPGEGRRTERIGALLMGYYEDGALRYAGRVGTGFTERTLTELARRLKPLRTDENPFDHPPKLPRNAEFVTPELVAEVEFREWTGEGVMRAPSFKGIRDDKPAAEVVRERFPEAEEPSEPSEPYRCGASAAPNGSKRAPEAAPAARRRASAAGDAGAGRPGRPRAAVRRRHPAPGRGAGGDRRRPGAEADQLGQGAVSGDRLHQGGSDRVLRADRAGRATASQGPAADAQALSERRRFAVLLREAVAVAPAPTGSRRSRCRTSTTRSPRIGRRWCGWPTWPTSSCTRRCRCEPTRCGRRRSCSTSTRARRPGLVECSEVALVLRGLFSSAGLESVVKTSGSKGMQMYVPLNTEVTYEQTKPFARTVAELLEQRLPELVVSRMTKRLRPGRVFVDWSQNDRHKTTVNVYSLRARPAPSVSTPVSWDEVKRCRDAGDAELLSFGPDDVLGRVAADGDLFAPLLSAVQELPRV